VAGTVSAAQVQLGNAVAPKHPQIFLFVVCHFLRA
jgi:hypothetical protein